MTPFVIALGLRQLFVMAIELGMTDRYRADMLRHFGYVLCSPFGILFLNWLISGFKLYDHIGWSFLLAILLAWIGFRILDKSYMIVYNLEKEYRNNGRT